MSGISDFRLTQEEILRITKQHYKESQELTKSLKLVADNQEKQDATNVDISKSLKLVAELSDKLLALIKAIFFWAILPLVIMVFVLALLFAGVKFHEISSFTNTLVQAN